MAVACVLLSIINNFFVLPTFIFSIISLYAFPLDFKKISNGVNFYLCARVIKIDVTGQCSCPYVLMSTLFDLMFCTVIGRDIFKYNGVRPCLQLNSIQNYICFYLLYYKNEILEFCLNSFLEVFEKSKYFFCK